MVDYSPTQYAGKCRFCPLSRLLDLLGNVSSPTMQTSPDVESQVSGNQDTVDEKDPNPDGTH